MTSSKVRGPGSIAALSDVEAQAAASAEVSVDERRRSKGTGQRDALSLTETLTIVLPHSPYSPSLHAASQFCATQSGQPRRLPSAYKQ